MPKIKLEQPAQHSAGSAVRPEDESIDIVIRRPLIKVQHRDIDTHIETEQGQEKTVMSLFQDYVLGRLDPRLIGGGEFDEDDSNEVDPLNTFGVTFEDVSRISDAGRSATDEIMRTKENKEVRPSHSSEQETKEEPHEQK